VSGRLQKFAAATAAWSVLAGCAWGAEVDASALAGTTLKNKRAGWSASLFVAPPERRGALEESLPPSSRPVVNAMFSRQVAKRTWIDFEATNIFDRAPPTDQFLAPIQEPRGVGLRLRIKF
jgi:hypothetical protein